MPIELQVKKMNDQLDILFTEQNVSVELIQILIGQIVLNDRPEVTEAATVSEMTRLL